jgi:peroxidase
MFPFHRSAHAKRSPRRRLRYELLDHRQLMAGDLAMPAAEDFLQEDVDRDGVVAPLDALLVLNEMRFRHDGSSASPSRHADVNRDGIISPLDAITVINRLNREHRQQTDRDPIAPPSVPLPAGSVSETHSIDGTGNNLAFSEWGAAGQAIQNLAPTDYADQIAAPAGADRPSPREISNLLFDQGDSSMTNSRNLSAFLYVWGQFIDHDLVLTVSQSEGESLDIAVPSGDPDFDPAGTGEQFIPMMRSVFDPTTGTSPDNPRKQVNSITAWMDASMVYGSDEATAKGLREFQGGRMLLGADSLLPTDEFGFFKAGDVRVNENPDLLAIQTLFVREHNFWADHFATRDPRSTDETLYQSARAMVIAEIQSITYHEFLPALLGRGKLQDYVGYDPTIDPAIANEFSTAAYRFGHSTVSDEIEFFDNDGRSIRDGVSLANAFFNPELLRETGIDPLLKYVASSHSQEIDLKVVDSLRNLLFGQPGQGGLDLAALNIQRGRDHGLADYNSVRTAYGLPTVTTFAEINDNPAIQADLQSLYGDVSNIDLWVGILAEDKIAGGSMGELGTAIIADQFERTRDGDRLWFENVFTGERLRTLQSTRLSDVILRNTEITNLQDNVFVMRAEISGRVLQGASSMMPASDRHPAQGVPRRESTRTGVPGIRIELLNRDHDVIATTTTDANGRYRFDSFAETGDYAVRIAKPEGSSEPDSKLIGFLVSTGDTDLRGLDFVIRNNPRRHM